MSMEEWGGGDYYNFYVTPPGGSEVYILGEGDQGGTWSAPKTSALGAQAYVAAGGSLTVVNSSIAGMETNVRGREVASDESGAVTIVVTTSDDDSNADDGATTLREALAIAPEGGVVVFDSALQGATIALGEGELTVARSVTIDASANSQYCGRREIRWNQRVDVYERVRQRRGRRLGRFKGRFNRRRLGL